MSFRKASMDRVECHSTLVLGLGALAFQHWPFVLRSPHPWLMNRFEKMMLVLDGCIHIHICEERRINELSVAVKHPMIFIMMRHGLEYI